MVSCCLLPFWLIDESIERLVGVVVKFLAPAQGIDRTGGESDFGGGGQSEFNRGTWTHDRRRKRAERHRGQEAAEHGDAGGFAKLGFDGRQV